MLLTQEMKVLQIAVGAAFRQATFSLVEVLNGSQQKSLLRNLGLQPFVPATDHPERVLDGC